MIQMIFTKITGSTYKIGNKRRPGNWSSSGTSIRELHIRYDQCSKGCRYDTCWRMKPYIVAALVLYATVFSVYVASVLVFAVPLCFISSHSCSLCIPSKKNSMILDYGNCPKQMKGFFFLLDYRPACRPDAELNTSRMTAMLHASHAVGAAKVFFFLLDYQPACRPDAEPNASRMMAMLHASRAVGAAKSTMSSAYKLHWYLTACPMGCCTPAVLALMNWFRASIARMKSTGDSGSPCQRPLQWWISSPGCPLRSILVDAVDNSNATQFLQCCPNPQAWRTSSENGQLSIKSFGDVQL